MLKVLKTVLSDITNQPIERAAEIRRQLRSERENAVDTQVASPSKPEINRLLSKDGRVLNSNQAQVRFKLEENVDTVVLKVKIPK